MTDTELEKAFQLFNASSTALVNHPSVKDLKNVIPEYYETKKFNAVRMELSRGALTLQELFLNVAKHFKELETLQIFLDRLEREGWVYCRKLGRYEWEQ